MSQADKNKVVELVRNAFTKVLTELEAELSAPAPEKPRQRRNLKREKIKKYAARYAK